MKPHERSYKEYEQDSVPLNPKSPFFFEHVSRYWWAARFAKGKDVLDCACGKGYGTYILSQKANTATGVDLNKRSLETARERFSRPNLQYLEQDVLELVKLGRKFDLVTAFEVIEHIPPHTTDHFLSALAGALNPGGLLLVSTPNHDVVLKSGVSVPDFHINNFRAVELRRALNRHFQDVTMLGQYQKKSGAIGLLFHVDYFNLRHAVGGAAKRLLGRHRAFAGKSLGVLDDIDVGQNLPDVDASYFDKRPSQLDSFEFSRGHWRQAGLTVAICAKPKDQR